VRRILIVLPLVMVVAGCSKARPVTQPQAAALEVPPAPPRVIAPPEPEQAPDETKAEEPEASKERRPLRPRAPQPRDRVEQKPAEAKPPEPAAETVKPPATPPVPLGQLQPKLAAPQSEVERQVTEQLGAAKRDLDRIDYRALNADAKSQYDTAKRFITQADEARRGGNLLLAQKLAEKAVGLASALVSR
jgi:hypothetical protein